jgi:hypothetical protein
MAKNNDKLYFGQLKASKKEKPTPPRETLEQFLARGGKIQRVAPGAKGGVRVSVANEPPENVDDLMSDLHSMLGSMK